MAGIMAAVYSADAVIMIPPLYCSSSSKLTSVYFAVPANWFNFGEVFFPMKFPVLKELVSLSQYVTATAVKLAPGVLVFMAAHMAVLSAAVNLAYDHRMRRLHRMNSPSVMPATFLCSLVSSSVVTS
jgi:hypothetical protein